MHQDGVAVRRGASSRSDTDRAAGAGPVLDHDRLAQLLGQLVEHDAPGEIVGVAGRERNDRGDVARGPTLRRSSTGRGNSDRKRDADGSSGNHRTSLELLIIFGCPTGDFGTLGSELV